MGIRISVSRVTGGILTTILLSHTHKNVNLKKCVMVIISFIHLVAPKGAGFFVCSVSHPAHPFRLRCWLVNSNESCSITSSGQLCRSQGRKTEQ